MKNIFSFTCTLLALLSSQVQIAQVSNYTFSQTVGTYGAPNTGSLVGITTQDDDVNTVTLPFNFVYNGSTYTSVNVCSNGYLSFAGITGTEYSALSDPFTSNVIAPFAQDLFMGTVISGDLSSGSNTITNVSSVAALSVGDALSSFMGDFVGSPTITAITGNIITVNLNALNNTVSAPLLVLNGSLRHNTTGTTPNQVTEFEYNNMTRFAHFNEVINFKVRLYETSNKIEFLYGSILPDSSNVPAEVGLKGNSSMDFNSREVTSTNTWSTSVNTTQITQSCLFSSAQYPDNGLSYMWTPSCSAPNIIPTFTQSPICAGQSVTLGVSGANSYSWNTGDSTSIIVVTPTITTTYTVFGSNGTCSSFVTLTQSVNPLPSLIVTSSSNTLCSGESATITAKGATTYSWNNGSTGQSIVVTPTANVIYSVNAISGSCSKTESIIVTVNTVPVITTAQSSTLICRGNSSTITASGASSYSWSNGSTSATTVLNPTVSTTYTVTGNNGTCIGKTTVKVSVSSCVGIEEQSDLESYQTYPNPFNEILNIEVKGIEDVKVVLTDALGKILYSAIVSPESRESIHTENLQAGLYVLTVSNSHYNHTKKVIKR